MLCHGSWFDNIGEPVGFPSFHSASVASETHLIGQMSLYFLCYFQYQKSPLSYLLNYLGEFALTSIW